MSERSNAKNTRSPALASKSCCDPGSAFLEPMPPGPPGPPAPPGGPPGAVSGVLLQAASNKSPPKMPIIFVHIEIPLVNLQIRIGERRCSPSVSRQSLPSDVKPPSSGPQRSNGDQAGSEASCEVITSR